jgi:hypothetical protein
LRLFGLTLTQLSSIIKFSCIFPKLKELVITPPNQSYTSSVYDSHSLDEHEMMTLLTNSVLNYSTSLEKLDISLSHILHTINCKCDNKNLVWNLPSLTTLNLKSELIPKTLILPRLKSVKIDGIYEYDVLRLVNDLSHAPIVQYHAIVPNHHEKLEPPLSVSMTLPLSTMSTFDHRPFLTQSFKCNFISTASLIHSLSQMTMLTNIDIALLTPLTYEVLGDLISHWPLIVNLSITLNNVLEMRTPLEILSSTRPPTPALSIIQLSHVLKLNLYGLDQRLADRLSCPTVNHVEFGHHQCETSMEYDGRQEVNIVSFLSSAQKLNSLVIKQPFEWKSSQTLPKLSLLSKLYVKLVTIESGTLSALMECAPSVKTLLIQITWNPWIMTALTNFLSSSTTTTLLEELSLISSNGLYVFKDSDINDIKRIISSCRRLASLNLSCSQTFWKSELFSEQQRLNKTRVPRIKFDSILSYLE